MPAAAPASRVLRFGAFQLNVAAGELRKHGIKLKLRPQAAKVLVLLATRPGEVVSREQLKDEIWGSNFFVDFEHGLNLCISQIRAALDDDADKPRYIETLPRHGYRFVARLEEPVGDAGVPSPAPTPTITKPAIQPEEHHGAEPEGLARTRRWVFGAVALAGLVAIVLFAGLRGRLPAGTRPVRIGSLAVLPLENLSHDAEQEYFADGMTDELITNLAQIRALRVISRNSVMQYKNKHKALPQIARELNVDAIIEGTVMRSGERVRITAQLIDARSDRHVWAETYERDLRDVLVLQDEVARAIAKEIKVQLLPEENSRLTNAPSINRESYELYLKGRYFWNKRDADDLNKALHYFERAAEKDPGYAPAQAGLADTYSLLGAAGYDVLPRAEAEEKARKAAQKALRIDDTLAEAHASLAFVIYSYDWDWTGAEKEFQRAISLNPNYATAHQWYSELLIDLGRNEEALVQAQADLALDPLSLNANQNLARVHYFARRMDQAIEIMQKTLEMDPNFAIGHLRLGRAYAAEGIYGQAITEFQEFARLSGDLPLAIASIGNARARSGDRSGANRALNQLTTLSKHKRIPSICFALIHIGLGNKDQAIAWLEEAYQERSDFLLVLKVDPLFDSLSSDPHFLDLLDRVGFPGQ
jgi:TolB-like protein/DNA-binding winged helix-turn-helix (wHTH) protein/Tfp pilus assembly protein PilF